MTKIFTAVKAGLLLGAIPLFFIFVLVPYIICAAVKEAWDTAKDL